jgi:hypothetical protein
MNPELGRWKEDQRDSQKKNIKAKPTFDRLLNKYMRQVAGLENWPREKHPRYPPKQQEANVKEREATRQREDVQPEHPPVGPDVPLMMNFPMGPYPMFHPGGPEVIYPQVHPMPPLMEQPIPWMPPMQQFQQPIWDPRMGTWMQYPPMSVPPFHLGWGHLRYQCLTG